MNWFRNMKIRRKLIAAFLAVAVIAGIVGAVGIVELRKTDASYTDLYNNYGKSLGYLTKVTEGFQRTRVNIRDLILDKNEAGRQEYIAKIQSFEKEIADSLSLYENTIVNAEDRQMFEELKASWTEFKVLRDKEIALVQNNQEDQALSLLLGDGKTISLRIDAAINQIVKRNIEEGTRTSDDLTQTTDTVTGVLILTVLAGMAIALILGMFVARIISRPVTLMVEAAEKIADGNLDVTIDYTSKDEIGQLTDAFKRMADNLNDVMWQIHSAAEQVAAGARQVSDSSMALSQGATEQASSVEQLTASLEEISSQTRLNADHAGKANQLAENAMAGAQSGNGQMKDMLHAMEEINQSSTDISKIIKVIDEIAFQTNILALNAAVEAARAGQHGKGFAVVAEEVRNLAARSASAAKETTEMIEGSIRKVEGGTRLANETAGALTRIVQDVASVAELVSEIAAASGEQAAGITQVSQGIQQVSYVVQNNSATSEESAASSEELSSQAELLKEQVSRFKLRRSAPAYNGYRGTGLL